MRNILVYCRVPLAGTPGSLINISNMLNSLKLLNHISIYHTKHMFILQMILTKDRKTMSNVCGPSLSF